MFVLHCLLFTTIVSDPFGLNYCNNSEICVHNYTETLLKIYHVADYYRRLRYIWILMLSDLATIRELQMGWKHFTKRLTIP